MRPQATHADSTISNPSVYATLTADEKSRPKTTRLTLVFGRPNLAPPELTKVDFAQYSRPKHELILGEIFVQNAFWLNFLAKLHQRREPRK